MSLYYPHVTQPLVGPTAFTEISDTASQSQAAVLLLLGRQLRDDDAAATARARTKRAGRYVAFSALDDDDREFPVPKIKPTRRRFSGAAVQQRVKKTYGYSKRNDATWQKAYADCAASLYADPSHDTMAELFHMSLDHRKDLVKIAAAAASYPIAADRDRARRVLVKGLRSADELERSLAATALARIDPKHPGLAKLTSSRLPPKQAQSSHTITIAHGTFAANSPWYQPPNGDFFAFIKTLRGDLYDQNDFFFWTGGYSDAARSDGANLLVQWVNGHSDQGLDLMGHSHGANVILLATNRGLTCGKTILLSCPVHVDKYFPDFSKVTTPIFSVHVKHDLVILADFGGQKFSHPKIQEIILPIWFDHFATHDPAVWQQNQIATQVSL